MNDSLDLRDRILKMRESNNLIVTKKHPLNNNLMSKFESSIKDDKQKKSDIYEDIVSEKNEKTVLTSHKNNSENLNLHNDKFSEKISKSTVNDNEAQFLMLANKFNEAVEVILELSKKVDKLERITYVNTYNQKTTKNNFSFFYFKVFIFVLLVTIISLGFLTFPFDFSSIRLIIVDIFSNL